MAVLSKEYYITVYFWRIPTQQVKREPRPKSSQALTHTPHYPAVKLPHDHLHNSTDNESLPRPSLPREASVRSMPKECFTCAPRWYNMLCTTSTTYRLSATHFREVSSVNLRARVACGRGVEYAVVEVGT